MAAGQLVGSAAALSQLAASRDRESALAREASAVVADAQRLLRVESVVAPEFMRRRDSHGIESVAPVSAHPRFVEIRERIAAIAAGLDVPCPEWLAR